MKTQMTFYFDYLCPFANRMALFLNALKKTGEIDFDICWKVFSLEQNNKKDSDIKLWEHPEMPSMGIPALAASKAAFNQGEQAFASFHSALFEARHKSGKKIGDLAVLLEIAEKSGVDTQQLKKDLEGEDCWLAVGKDHEEAIAEHNIFGVPTLIFSKGRPVYIKLTAIPQAADEQLSLFNLIKDMAEDRPYLLELKRPDLKIL